MEKLRQWFSRTPPPASDYPTPIHWSPYLRPDPGRRCPEPAPEFPYSASPGRMPDLSLRKRLVRLPTGDDVLLIGDGSTCVTPSPRGTRRLPGGTASFVSSATASVRRNLSQAFGEGCAPSPPPALALDRPAQSPPGLERKRSLTPQPQPPRVPMAPAPGGRDAHAAWLQAFLEPRTLAPADYAALRKGLLAREDFLAPATIDAFAQALAQRVLGAARPASRGMELLIEHLLGPLETPLGHVALGALIHGLQRGAGRLVTAPPRLRRFGSGVGVAQDVLSRHVAASRQRLGLARHAMAVCALERAHGLGQVLRTDTSPQALGRLLAHDPLRVLWHPDPLLDEADRLRLLDAALRLPPGIRSRAHAEQLCDAMLATTARHLQPAVLTILLAAAGERLPAGSLALRRLGGDLVARMEAIEMTGALAQCLDDVQRAVDEIGAEEAAALAVLGLGRGTVVIDTLEEGRALAFDEESVQRAAASRLLARQEAALEAAAARMVRFHARLDVGAQPAYLAAQAARLRARQVPGDTPEGVVIAHAAADALAQRAGQLSAPKAPGPP